MLPSTCPFSINITHQSNDLPCESLAKRINAMHRCPPVLECYLLPLAFMFLRSAYFHPDVLYHSGKRANRPQEPHNTGRGGQSFLHRRRGPTPLLLSASCVQPVGARRYVELRRAVVRLYLINSHESVHQNLTKTKQLTRHKCHIWQTMKVNGKYASLRFYI